MSFIASISKEAIGAILAWWADWLAYTGVDDVKELLRLSNNGKVRREKDAERLV